MNYNPETGIFTDDHGRRRGWQMVSGYRAISYRGRQWYEHRLAWLLSNGVEPSGQVDHINGIRTDNRLANLRVATPSQNAANSLKGGHGTAGYSGVYFDGRNKFRKWVAKINVKNRQITLGYFETAEEAGLAAEVGRDRFHGRFAAINRPACAGCADSGS